MNIAVFADVHGRILLAFKLCARWQRETGEHIDAILQAGDLGVFPRRDGMDKATIRHAERDPSELGFASDFLNKDETVAAALGETDCPLLFVRGNHEDHAWLDARELIADGPLFPIDVYERIFCLKTGVPYTVQSEDSRLTVVGIGRVGPPFGEHEATKAKYIQMAELERLYSLDDLPIDVLLAHDTRRDGMISGLGIEEIGLILNAKRPAYHFFGHYGGPCLIRRDTNGVTQAIKLADLHWDPADTGYKIEPGAMGILRWRSPTEHAFEVVAASWLKEYSAHTWRYV